MCVCVWGHENAFSPLHACSFLWLLWILSRPSDRVGRQTHRERSNGCWVEPSLVTDYKGGLRNPCGGRKHPHWMRNKHAWSVIGVAAPRWCHRVPRCDRDALRNREYALFTARSRTPVYIIQRQYLHYLRHTNAITGTITYKCKQTEDALLAARRHVCVCVTCTCVSVCLVICVCDCASLLL